jgi:hypothetical protein
MEHSKSTVKYENVKGEGIIDVYYTSEQARGGNELRLWQSNIV